MSTGVFKGRGEVEGHTSRLDFGDAERVSDGGCQSCFVAFVEVGLDVSGFDFLA
jgi:hypothetical protein